MVMILDNIMSDTFYRRITNKLRQWNISFKPSQPLSTIIKVDGVGKRTNECKNHGEIPVCLADKSLGTFQGPIIENSAVPALWGLQSLSRQRVLIDCYNKRVYLVGPEGYNLSCSPGTKSYELESARSGHLLLPITEWKHQTKVTLHTSDADSPPVHGGRDFHSI